MHVIYGRTYRYADEINERLRALVGECDGNVQGAAREEWRALNEALDSTNARMRNIGSAAAGPNSRETATFGNG